ncbi:glycosyltransferase family 2 protein [Klebsiella africana]|uniref:Putative glycosyltransferase EpsJ n=1 Tax=Klebsiella africana TaxID=2489010 RepID=A0A8B6ITR1_9ENTR|nr:glycosyltransferase family 2 protein [Klebsiella africana]UDD42057.1 glycosyltransferase [Klebsiella africana]VGP99528.1 putative glycosyltransferase EpsJ [Klebsiella africana]
MKFSVIIPAFNAELYIEECIQSVLDNACHDIEIIIINDGSTDRTGDIINSFKDDFIHKIHTKNKGQSAARNTGINKATGDYILFLDSDDKLNKKTLHRLLEVISESKADVILFESDVFFDDELLTTKFNPIYERAQSLADKALTGVEFFKTAMNENNYIVSPCLYTFKKEFSQDIKFKEGIIHEDNIFTTMLLLHNNPSVYCIKEKLYQRRVRHGSVMTQKKGDNHLNGYYACVSELINNPPNNHLLAHPEYNKFLTHMLDCFKYTNLDIARQYKDEMRQMQIQHESEINEIKSHISALKQSSSWKITAPLRKIKDIIKK